MAEIDWKNIRESLPATCAELVDLIEEEQGRGGEDPARAVDKALRERIARFRNRLDVLKGSAG